MREHLKSGLTAAIAAAGYFLLVDFARPALERRGLVPAWWAMLGLYAIIVFVRGFSNEVKVRPKLTGIGFLLFASTLYLYDPTINPHLKLFGLGWLWIASLIVGILWLLAFMKITLKDQQRESGRLAPPH